MYRKRVLTVLTLVVIILITMIAFNKTLWRFGNLELDKDWQFVANHYYSPMEGVPASTQTIDLYDLAGGNIGGQSRIRGTLYKSFDLPTSWLNSDLILYNNFFLDNAKIYINGDLYAVQGSFATTGSETYLSSSQHFIFLKPTTKTIRMMILFDGYQDHIPAFDEFYLLPSASMLKRLSVSYGLNAIGIIATLYLMWLVAKKPLTQRQKIQEVSFVGLLLARWAFVTNSMIVHMLPIKLDLWLKIGAIVQMLMLCYALVILFERKKIWRRRLNVVLAVITFILVVLVLLFDFINLKLLIVFYTLAVVVIYALFRRQIRATDRYTEMLIINVCLFADTIYRVHPFSPPIHLLVLAVYGVIWHQVRYFKGYDIEERKLQESPVRQVAHILKEDTASLYERLAEKASLAAVCLSKNLPVYTPAAEAILKPELGNARIENYLYPHDLAQRQYFGEVVTLTLTTNNIEEKRVYLELLPDRIDVNERVLKLSYDWLEEEGCILIILRDVTQESNRESEILEELRVRDVVIEVLKDRESYEHFHKDYRNFIEVINEHKRMESFDILQFWAYVTSRISYFAIKLRSFKMEKSALKIERLLSDLSLLQDKNDVKILKEYESLIETFEIDHILDDVFKVIKGYVDALEGHYEHKINASQLKDLEAFIMEIPDEKLRQDLLSRLWRTKHMRFKQLVHELNPYTQDLAISLGKKIKPIEVTGDEVYIDQERVPYFMQASFIIINNAVKHVIEPPRERVRRHKSEYGAIMVKLTGSSKRIGIEIMDDGRGIDVNAVRNRLILMNPDHSEDIKKLGENEILNCLLNGQYPCDFGSKEPGLIALQGEIINLGGQMFIESKAGHHTKIIIDLPNERSYVF